MSQRTLLFDRLKAIGINYTTYEHIPVFTCAESETVCATLPKFGQCKNLFLKDRKKRLWLIVALNSTQVQLRELAKTLDAPELRFADAALLMQTLGVEAGSVTPFALINDTQHAVTVVLDRLLLEQTVVGFHPLKNDATTVISPDDLLKFIKSCGNTILFMD